MPATLFSRIDPGQPAGHTVLGDRLTNMAAAVNDLPLEAVEPHSLTRQHLPSVVPGTPGTAVLEGVSEHAYDSRVGAQPYPGWNTAAGWRVINSAGGGTPAPALGTELRVTGLGVTLSSTVSIEVWAEVEVVDIELWDFTAGPPARSTAVRPLAVFGVFAIQYSPDNVTWYHLARTERYLDGETDDDATNALGGMSSTNEQQNRRMTIATRIRSTDPGGAITVNHVRMVVSCHDGAFLAAASDAFRCRVRLREGRISAFGKQHGTLT